MQYHLQYRPCLSISYCSTLHLGLSLYFAALCPKHMFVFLSSQAVSFSCQLHEQIEGWADDFGGDFELTVTGQRVIFVTGAEDIRRILLSRPTKFKRGWTPVRHAIRNGTARCHPCIFALRKARSSPLAVNLYVCVFCIDALLRPTIYTHTAHCPLSRFRYWLYGTLPIGVLILICLPTVLQRRCYGVKQAAMKLREDWQRQSFVLPMSVALCILVNRFRCVWSPCYSDLLCAGCGLVIMMANKTTTTTTTNSRRANYPGRQRRWGWNLLFSSTRERTGDAPGGYCLRHSTGTATLRI